jgi:hypothetical protein
MRVVVVLLVLANLAFFAYARLDNAASGEASEPLQPDKIKLLTAQQVAALGADRTALADTCVEWGPFSDSDRARAMADLEPLALGKLLTQRRIDAPKGGASTLLVIRDPSAQALARLREIAPAYASAEVKTSACDR